MPLHASFRLLGKTPLLIAVLVCVLALPALVGRIHSNAGAIRAQENRKMATLPPLLLFRNSAQAFIRATEAWMNDSIGFRQQANALYRKFQQSSFHKAPQPNITLGLDGHVFLNSPDTSRPFLFFDALCIKQGDASPELFRHLDATMAAAGSLFQRQGAEVVFAIVPSPLTLYADKLPLNLPARYREACAAYPEKDHVLARLQRHGESTGRYRIFYPYELFASHKNEKYFWPKERFHWEGRSAYLFARHLLQTSKVANTVALHDPAVSAPVEDDLTGFFGYSRPVTAYVYPYAKQPSALLVEPWAKKLSEQQILTHFRTSRSLSDKTALMIANSFGGMLAPHLARGFRHFYRVDTNWLQRQKNQMAVFAALREHIQPDYVYFVFDDQNLESLPRWLDSLVQLQQKELQSSVRPESGHPAGP